MTQKNNNCQNDKDTSQKGGGQPGVPGGVTIHRRHVVAKTPRAAEKRDPFAMPRRAHRVPDTKRSATTVPGTTKGAAASGSATRTPPESRGELAATVAATPTRSALATAGPPRPSVGTPSAPATCDAERSHFARPGSEPATSSLTPAATTVTATAFTAPTTTEAVDVGAARGGSAAANPQIPTGPRGSHRSDQQARSGRLRSGQLRALVAQLLAERHNDRFTVTELSNMLRRSPGAIANAAEKLCEQGLAIRIRQHPKTYQNAGESAGA